MNNKNIVINFFEKCYNNKDYNFAMEYFSNDYFDHSPAAARSNIEAVGILKIVHEKLPDLQVSVLECIEENGIVAIRVSFQATHNNEFMEVPATGKIMEWEALELFKIMDKKITESWGYWPEVQIKEMLL